MVPLWKASSLRGIGLPLLLTVGFSLVGFLFLFEAMSISECFPSIMVCPPSYWRIVVTVVALATFWPAVLFFDFSPLLGLSAGIMWAYILATVISRYLSRRPAGSSKAAPGRQSRSPSSTTGP